MGRKPSEKSIRIKEIMIERNCAHSTARYYYEKEIGNIIVKDAVYRNDLTKDMLVEWGITDVKPDGSAVYVNGELTHWSRIKSSKYIRVKICTGHWEYLQRLVYVWNNPDHIQPAGYAVDHIDEDTLNNDISNLRLLTIGENAARSVSKRVGWKNQYNKDLTDAERLAKYEARQAAIKERNEAREAYRANRTPENRAAWKIAVEKCKNI